MKILHAAIAGTLESSDLVVKVSPYDDGLDITINSEVYKQFGEQITAVVNETLSALNVTQGQIIVEDRARWTALSAPECRRRFYGERPATKLRGKNYDEKITP